MKYIASIIFAAMICFFLYTEVAEAAPEAEADPLFFGFGHRHGYGGYGRGYGGYGHGHGYGRHGFYG
jgi:hypothetical protein